MSQTDLGPAAGEPAVEHWWIEPVTHVVGVLLALAAAATVLWLVLHNVQTPRPKNLIADYGYVGVAIGAFADSFGLPSSGEIVLLLGSAAAAASTGGNFNIVLVIAVAWAFAVLGDSCAYAIGRAAGPRVLHRIGVHDGSAAHQFMDRHGPRAVVFARLVAGIRTKVAVLSGSTKLPFHRYVIADGLGAAIWAVAVGTLGYLFSGSVQRLIGYFDRSSGVLGSFAAIGIALGVTFLAYRYIRSYHPRHRR